MQIYGKCASNVVRCLLLGVACDMPASRKSCGFLSHSANLGCTKCYKVFPGRVGCKNYSGFDRDNWKCRTNFDHRMHVREIRNATSLTSRNARVKIWLQIFHLASTSLF